MVDGAALEKRSPRLWSVGSNPTLSAIVVKLTERCWSGLSGAPGERE